MRRLYIAAIAALSVFASSSLLAQTPMNKFRQIDEILPTPNTYRTASGAPGHQYWQQRADYKINVEVNDENQSVLGEETITYFNQSPDVLTYLWLQLDQNLFEQNSMDYRTTSMKLEERMTMGQLRDLLNTFDGGFKIEYVKDALGKDLLHTKVETMMRVDLPAPLKPGASYTFKIKWKYNVHDAATYGGRTGYEFFPKDGNYAYYIAQFYPRMCAYMDNEGWQTNQYLGSGEFTLSFGNYELNITVPDDHIVASTGELQNPTEVLTADQRSRYEQSKTASKPVIIVTQKEAEENEKDKSKGKKTWRFKASDVRDVAFATSRKFIWDAQGVPMGGKTIMAMSYYPKEGNPLWEQYSTRAVAHTLRCYSKYTFDYPYPVAISTHASFTGMEYPMICFNFGRPEADGTYSDRIKQGMIGVIIHEVGHNYFPMIVNSDERQWSWMDEGLNSFLQYLTEQEWEKGWPSRRGPAYRITDYMKGDKKGQSPIMENSELLLQFGNNAYGKPAAALNILRETVLGRELFDFAFKEYSNRWKFKHPSPADFFRTMEEASGTDLDWFWRGWFYTTDHVDISLDQVKVFRLDSKNPEVEKPLAEKREKEKAQYISDIRNKDTKTLLEKDPALSDFYNTFNPFAVNALDKQEYEKYMTSLSADEKKLLESGYNFFQLDFTNVGGLVSPLVIELSYSDGSKEEKRIPAEVWRQNNEKVSKVFFSKKELVSVQLDPHLELADCDTENNAFPRQQAISRFQLFNGGAGGRFGAGENTMQREKRAKELEKK